ASDRLGGEVLGVLDAEAAVAAAVAGFGIGEDAQEPVVGLVADGVDRDVESCCVGAGDPAAQRGGIRGEEAGGLGRVVVGIVEPGGGRAERSVDEALESAPLEA